MASPSALPTNTDADADSVDNNAERFWQWRWAQITTHIKNKEYSEAYRLCARLVFDASTPVVLQIHCHTALATGSIDPLIHAGAALDLLSKIEEHLPADEVKRLRTINNNLIDKTVEAQSRAGVMDQLFVEPTSEEVVEATDKSEVKPANEGLSEEVQALSDEVQKLADQVDK